jgi:hypothetical protein
MPSLVYDQRNDCVKFFYLFMKHLNVTTSSGKIKVTNFNKDAAKF